MRGRCVILGTIALALIPSASLAKPPPARLVFASSQTGSSEIYSVEPSGRGLVQLTSRTPFDVRNPVPSPNGRYISFTRSFQLWVMNSDGSGQRQLATGRDPAWTPDSRSLAYVPTTFSIPPGPVGLRMISLDGSGDRALTTGAGDHPAWSRDGRSLLFLRDKSLVVLRGDAEKVLAEDAASPVWSRGGRWIAYAQRGVLYVVRPDDTGRRRLVPGSQPDWSPDGRRIVFVRDGIRVVTIADRRVRTLTRNGGDSDPRWRPGGDEIAFMRPGGDDDALGVERELRVVTLAGLQRTVVPAYPWGTALDSPRWIAPGGALPGPQPERMAPVVAPSELQLRSPITAFAADGERLGFSVCGYLAVWQPGASGVATVRPGACGAGISSVYSVAVAGDRVGWAMTPGGGNQVYYDIFVAGRGQAPTLLATGARCCVADSLLPWVRMGYPLGDGPLLTFSTWRACDDIDAPRCGGQPRRVVSQSVWRVREPAFQGSCAGRAGPCQEIVSAAGVLTPLALDAGRIVVRRADGSVAVVDEAGTVLRSVSFAPGEALGAELSGNDLVVLVMGALHHYDVARGELLRSWPLPRVPSAGFCGVRAFECPRADLRLEDLARGVVAYVLNGEVHLLRLADGLDRVVAPGTAAELEDAGLFYAQTVGGDWPGRIRFAPFSQLPLG